MIHHRQCLPLGFKPGNHLAAVHARLDDLERNAAADGPLLFRHVDHAHAPFADLLQQLVGPDLRAWLFGHRLGMTTFKGGSRRCKEAARVAMRSEKALDPLTQIRILAAGSIEHRSPCLGVGQIQGLGEDGFFGRGCRPHGRTPAGNFVLPSMRDPAGKALTIFRFLSGTPPARQFPGAARHGRSSNAGGRSPARCPAPGQLPPSSGRRSSVVSPVPLLRS